MLKALFFVSIIAIVLLLTVTVILVRLNWSEKLYSPILSLILAGTVTTFITVLLLLKEETFETSFPTYVIVNSETHLPTSVIPMKGSQLESRLSSYLFLASPKVTIGGKTTIQFDSPNNSSDEHIFYGEMLQYAILKEIVEFHKSTESIYLGVGGMSSQIYKSFQFSESQKISLRDIASELNKNRFSKSHSHKYFVDNNYINLPPKTIIELDYSEDSSSHGSKFHRLIFRKPHYFRIEIAIRPSFGAGTVPANLAIDSAELKISKTNVYVIDVSAKFEKITAGNWRTQEYKKRYAWMTEELKNKFSDTNER